MKWYKTVVVTKPTGPYFYFPSYKMPSGRIGGRRNEYELVYYVHPNGGGEHHLFFKKPFSIEEADEAEVRQAFRPMVDRAKALVAKRWAEQNLPLTEEDLLAITEGALNDYLTRPKGHWNGYLDHLYDRAHMAFHGRHIVPKVWGNEDYKGIQLY